MKLLNLVPAILRETSEGTSY